MAKLGKNIKILDAIPVMDVLSRVEDNSQFCVKFRMFKTKGISCVECGIKGFTFLITRDVSKPEVGPSISLYAQDEHGELVEMTKDHIRPISKGGQNILANLQPMCEDCNFRKADS